jgi:hypothetical protein
MCPERIAQTIEDGSVDETIAPVAFRDISLKCTPDQHLVCAILGPRATAKMVVCEQSSTTSQLQTARRILTPLFSAFSVSSVLKGFKAFLCHSNFESF